ncbi:hypothetical protein CAPTEDRAFT_197120 [Capitella teleta]|uniref:Uncharacterized protein n=1 Tax=Capitella teleta TaxID=283909 RepID=R7TJ20_CAPTE|nr:hypothetical protein CAPTEDRAFT_197120 [Capitella teleta]|eukprot:ELT93709.1 hypothetical protein CAPTEDRAFT_197120 [Capitella teleta]
MKRRLRTRFSLLQPSVDLQGRTLDHNLRGSQQQRYKVGDAVSVIDHRMHSPKWSDGIVIKVMIKNYLVRVENQVWKRHEDQLRPRSSAPVSAPELPTSPAAVPGPAPALELPVGIPMARPLADTVPEPRRNPARDRRAPERFRDFVFP